MKRTMLPVALLASLGLATPGVANEFEAQLRELASTTVQSWVQDQVLLGALREQNARTAAYSQARIDELDATWRQETVTGGELIEMALSNPLSSKLKRRKQEGKGRFTEIFVTDARGLNVGQSDITSDYWQGDEAKWQVPFSTGDVHIGEVEFDESTQSYQSQLSVPVIEADEVIGVITVGVNVEMLAQLN